MSEPGDEPVPRLPRGKGLRLDRAMMFRIAATLGLLVMVLVTAHPCADATSKFVTGFGEQGSGSASTAMPHPGTVDLPSATQPTNLGDYEVLRPDMTEAEQKAIIERAMAKARATSAAAAGSGSATQATPAELTK